MVYQVKNSIFSFRELEWRIKQDTAFRRIVGLESVPDYSTIALRVNKFDKELYYGIFNILIIPIAFEVTTTEVIKSCFYYHRLAYDISSIFFEFSFCHSKYSVISKYFLPETHFSSCSISNAPIRRIDDSRLGNILITFSRLRISSFSRSKEFRNCRF